jgi:hypothetical protein
MQESGSDELSLFNPKGIYPFPLGIGIFPLCFHKYKGENYDKSKDASGL